MSAHPESPERLDSRVPEPGFIERRGSMIALSTASAIGAIGLTAGVIEVAHEEVETAVAVFASTFVAMSAVGVIFQKVFRRTQAKSNIN